MHIRILRKISNNQYSRWNQQRLSPSWLVRWLVRWLVGDKLFSSHTGHHMGHGAVGAGEGVVNVHEYSLERGWGHDVGRGQRGSQVGNNFLGKPKVFSSPVVYDAGLLLLEKPRIQENPYKGKIVCCVSSVLNHRSIPAIVFYLNGPHLYSNVECGHEKQGGHLVQTLSRGRLFSRLVIVQDTDTTQGWEVHGDIAGAPRRPQTPPILSKTRPPLMTKSPGLPLPLTLSCNTKTSMPLQSLIFRVSFAHP